MQARPPCVIPLALWERRARPAQGQPSGRPLGSAFLRCGRIGLAIVAAAFAQPASPAAEPSPAAPQRVITTLAEAHRLWPEIAGEEPALRVEGVVTGTMPSGAFRLHDGERGIYVTGAPVGQNLQPRDRVRVTGVVRKGGY